MKKKLKLLALLTAALSIGSSNIRASKSFTENFLDVNNEPAKLEKFVSDFKFAVPYEGKFYLYNFKYEPKVINNKSCLSLYDVAIALGIPIYWDSTNRLVIIESEDKGVVLPIDKKVIYADGKIYNTDIPATIDPETGRTYLPLRTIGDVLGYNVKWNNKNKTAVFSKKDGDVDLKYSIFKETNDDEFDEYFKKVKENAVEDPAAKGVKEDKEEIEHNHSDATETHDHDDDKKDVREIVITKEEIAEAEKTLGAKLYLKLDDIKAAMKEAIKTKSDKFSFLVPYDADINSIVHGLTEANKENKGEFNSGILKDKKPFLMFVFVK